MRVAIVGVFMLAVTVAIGAVALLPADIRARAADRTALQAVSVSKKNNNLAELDQAERELAQGTTLLAALGNDAAQARFSDVVRSIVSMHSPVIVFSFNLSRLSTSSIEATLQGVAPTRDDLLAFKARLEGLAPGARVDLPISTLAKNTNVQFSLKLTEQLQ